MNSFGIYLRPPSESGLKASRVAEMFVVVIDLVDVRCEVFRLSATLFLPEHSTPFLYPFSLSSLNKMVPTLPSYLLSRTNFISQSYGGYGGGGGGYGGGGGGWGGGGGGGHDDRMSNLGGGLRTIDWASAKIEQFEKNFYVEDKRVTARSDREIDEFKRTKEIKVYYLPSYPISCTKSFDRFKAAMFPDPLLPLTSVVSPTTSWYPSAPKDSQLPHPFSARHGLWLSVEETLLQLHKPEVAKRYHLLSQPCSTSTRKSPFLVLLRLFF